MNMNITLICSDQNRMGLVEGIVFQAGFSLRTFPDINSVVGAAVPEQHSLLLLDLDSVSVDPLSLKGMKKLLRNSTLIGISVQNYHPYLRESVQNGIFTALVKPPFEAELTYWINSLRLSGDFPQTI